jgi:cytochrome c peroxidase
MPSHDTAARPFALAALVAPLTIGAFMFHVTGDTRGVSALPPVPVPAGNPITEDKRVLGKALFYEQQLGSDNTVACASCHAQTTAGADARIAFHPGFDGIFGNNDDVRGSPGVVAQDADADYRPDTAFGLNPQVTARSAPPMINAAFSEELFWDGRAQPVFTDPTTGQVVLTEHAALESQSVNPPTDAVEMAHADRDWDQIAARLAHARPLALASDLPPDLAQAVLDARTYPELFRRAFGDPAITPARIAMALGTYQRTLIADQTPWDAFMAGDTSALTPAEQRGWNVFQSGAARCDQCHVPPLFTDGTYRNIGLRPVGHDAGRQNVTGDPADAGRFKVPGLRNAGLKRSFMHTGQLATLDLVVLFYANSAHNNDNLDPLMNGIQLNAGQQADLVAFLDRGLTDPRVEQGLFPFDAPDLFNAPGTTTNPVLFPGGRPDSQGRVPLMVARTPPLIGSDEFKLGLGNVAPGATATLVMSLNAPVAGVITPDTVIATVNASTGPGDPAATVYWPIPGTPLLDGQIRYFQWRVDDPNQAQPALSRVARATLVCGFGDCATGCPADLDRNLRLDFFDITRFLTLYNQQDPNADLAEPLGVFNFFDLAEFIGLYTAGCP